MNQPLTSKEVQALPIGFNPTSFPKSNRRARREFTKGKKSLRGVDRIQYVFEYYEDGTQKYIKRILHYSTLVGIGGNKNC